MLDGDLAGILVDILEDLDEDDLAEVFLRGTTWEMGADEPEDEGVELADEVRGCALIPEAQAGQAGFHIEASFSHER